MNTMRRWITAILLVIVALPLQAAIDMHIKIKGARQGAFNEEKSDKGVQGCIAYEHSMSAPRDAASGLATGRRTHSPMRIVRYVGKATPQLARAFTDGEVLETVTMEVFGRDDNRQPVLLYTITLTNARITGIRQYTDISAPLTTQPGSGFEALPIEEVTLTYQKIEWTWVNPNGGNVTHEDSWSSTR